MPTPAKKEKKKKSKPTPAETEDVPMEDAPALASVPKTTQEDFSAIYLRKIASEFADDLDKVREAQDFKASSVPMLIHALKQGESLFSGVEKGRVISATSP